MSVQVKLAESVPLDLLLIDGDDEKYVLAHLFDATYTPVPGSPFTLTNIGLGRYVNSSFVLPLISTYGRLTATYIVYMDSDFLEEDIFYDRAEDVFDIVASSAAYTNRMTTSLNSATFVQEVLVWTERDGVAVPGTDCIMAVKDSNGEMIWSDALSTPDAEGVFKFTGVFNHTGPGNYYIEITITVDSVPRTNKQPFVTLGS